MEVIVQLSRDAAAESARRAAASESEQPPPALGDLDLPLEPMHPGESDPALSAYFTVEVADAAAAERAIEALRQHDAVAAAYVKPAAEPP